MKLPPGKVPINILENIVFKNLGAKREEVALGPLAGFDGAVIDVGSRSLVVSMDPITGALDRIGWLAVNVNANDIATFGVEPTFFLSCIMLSEKSDEKTVEIISNQMGKAAETLGIAIVGGHCEKTPGLANPIVAGCAMGITEKGNYVTAGGAHVGDKLILTKSAGIEGTVILASDRKEQLKRLLSAETLRNATQFYDQMSIVKDAMIAFRTGGVDAMHDPTEGGVAGGVHEMADAAGLGVNVYEEKIRIQSATAQICEFFQIDPLQLVSSGALLVSARPKHADAVVEKLKENNVPASVIGDFLEDRQKRTITRKDGKKHALPRPLSDNLWTALSRK